jgi:prepilin-type N-terminal cleavage/methylation domain-containing protein
MHLSRLRHGVADAGFTLIELLITISVLGIITVPIGNMVIDYFRNSAQASQRISASHDVQIANAYWQQDVASIGIRSSTYDTTNNTFPTVQSVNNPFPCSVPVGVASPLIVLGWNQYDTSGNATTINVAYATASSGTQLVRLHCTGTTLDSNVNLVDDLSATPTCDFGTGSYVGCGSNTATPASVSMKLTISDPAASGSYQVSLTGQRRQTG